MKFILGTERYMHSFTSKHGWCKIIPNVPFEFGTFLDEKTMCKISDYPSFVRSFELLNCGLSGWGNGRGRGLDGWKCLHLIFKHTRNLGINKSSSIAGYTGDSATNCTWRLTDFKKTVFPKKSFWINICIIIRQFRYEYLYTCVFLHHFCKN